MSAPATRVVFVVQWCFGARCADWFDVSDPANVGHAATEHASPADAVAELNRRRLGPNSPIPLYTVTAYRIVTRVMADVPFPGYELARPSVVGPAA